jgi:hypothetical protein
LLNKGRQGFPNKGKEGERDIRWERNKEDHIHCPFFDRRCVRSIFSNLICNVILPGSLHVGHFQVTSDMFTMFFWNQFGKENIKMNSYYRIKRRLCWFISIMARSNQFRILLIDLHRYCKCYFLNFVSVFS